MKTILIVRLSAIGDIVMASPVAAALKAQHPNCRVLWLTQPECASLVQDNPNIDEVISWPRAQWQQLWRERKWRRLYRSIREFSQMLKAKNIDTAIDLQGLLKSGILTWLSGAEHKIGLGSKEGSQLLMDQVIDRGLGDADLIGSEYRWLCQQVGAPTEPWTMQIGASDQAIANADALLETLDSDRYIAICPFTTRPQKHWHDAGWRALIPKLSTQLNTLDDNIADQLPIVMLGGPGDSKHAQHLAKHHSVFNWVGKTRLPEAAHIISKASAVVGVDTGLTHMGHAYNIPTVALFGSTRPYLKTDTDNGKVIYLNKHCAPCKRKPTCDDRFHCLNDIAPDFIIQQLKALLDQPIDIRLHTS